MASLTESSLIFDMINPEEPKEPKINNWYNRVYLCLEINDSLYTNTFGPIKGFNCYKFYSIESANFAWYNKKEYNKINIRHTIIPICKWIPSILDKYVLDWKLKKIYWLGNHYVSTGYNGNKNNYSSK